MDEADAGIVINEDGGAAVAVIGKSTRHLRIKANLRQYHLVDRNALPQLGSNKDLVRGFRFLAMPRNSSHRAEEASGALGELCFSQTLRDLAILGHFLEGSKGGMAEMVLPSH